MKNIPHFEDFVNESNEQAICESISPAIKYFALQIIKDEKVQNTVKDLIGSIVGKTVDVAFGDMNKKLGNHFAVSPTTSHEMLQDTGDFSIVQRKIETEEDAKVFVNDYMVDSTIRNASPDVVPEENPGLFSKLADKVKPMFRSFIDKLNENEVFEATINGKRVCIFPGRFQPFHNGHIEALRRTSQALGCPVIPLQIFSKTEKSPFDVVLLAKIGHRVAAEFDFIQEFSIYPPGNKTVIPQMVKFIQEKGFNPIGVGCGSDRQKDYERQVAYLTSEKSDVLVDEFTVAMVDSRQEGGPSGTKVREAIIADDETAFKILTPKSVHPFYKELRKKLTQS